MLLLSSLILVKANNCHEECWRRLGQRLVDCLDYIGTSKPWMDLTCQGGATLAYGICLSLC